MSRKPRSIAVAVLALAGYMSFPAFAGVDDGIVACYPMEANAQNQCGSANDGVAVGTIGYPKGVIGQAASFDGVSSAIEITDNFMSNFSALSVCVWVKINPDLSGNYQAFVSQVGNWFNDDKNAVFRLGTTGAYNDNRVSFVVNLGGPFGYQVISASPLDIDRWHHVCGTFDGADLRVFLDGVDDSSSPTSGWPPGALPPLLLKDSTNIPVTIGWLWQPQHHHYLSGLLDDVRIYNRALSASEVWLLAATGSDGDDDGVDDDDDLCPGSIGGPVDAVGCSDAQVDFDGDGYCDLNAPSAGPAICVGTDNCPTVPNPLQEQTGNNVGSLYGDACVNPDVELPPDLIIGDGPVIGEGTTFEDGIVIGDNANIGSNVQFKQNVTAGDNVVLGHEVIIEHGVVMGDDVNLGYKVKLEENVTIGDRVSIGNESGIKKAAIIKADASVGAFVTIEVEVEIGVGATVSGGAFVPWGTVIPDSGTFP